MTTSVVLPRKLPDSSRMFGNFLKPDLAKLMLSFYKFIYDPGPFLPPSQNSEKYVASTHGRARCTGASLLLFLNTATVLRCCAALWQKMLPGCGLGRTRKAFLRPSSSCLMWGQTISQDMKLVC